MFSSNSRVKKVFSIFAAALLALVATSCSGGSQTSSERKPSVRETRWLAACRADSFSFECEEAIANYEAKDMMFYSLSNSKVDYEDILQNAIGPHNVWCYTEEGRCYTTIHVLNNSGSPYTNSPTAMIEDGDWKFHYAVLEGNVSFDGISNWPLEKEHFFDLNPGQSWREIGADEIWRAGFNIKASKMQNLQELNVGDAQSDAFYPDGPRIPLCKKSNSRPELIIYEDCRILNDWDYIDGKFQKKVPAATPTP